MGKSGGEGGTEETAGGGCSRAVGCEGGEK